MTCGQKSRIEGQRKRRANRSEDEKEEKRIYERNRYLKLKEKKVDWKVK